MSGPQLRDIVLPAEPAFWPPAPGWWVLAAVVLLAVFALLRWLFAAWRRLRRARRLRTELELALGAHQSPQQRLAMMSELLRRWSTLQSPNGAALIGEDWLRMLDGGLADAPFSRGVGRLLLQGPYMAQPPLQQMEALEDLVRRRILHGVRNA